MSETGDSRGSTPTGERSSTIESGTRPDPRKAFRGPASACLSMQAMILPFALFVMARVEGGLTTVKVVWVLALTLGMIVAIVFFSRPWGLPLAIGLQVATVLGWIVSPSLGVLGVVFALVWALMLWMRHEVVRRQAAWPITEPVPAVPDPPGEPR